MYLQSMLEFLCDRLWSEGGVQNPNRGCLLSVQTRHTWQIRKRLV